MSELPLSESRAVLRSLFPGGLRDCDVWEELCPEGWEKSPLFASFHPPAETAYREYLAQQETMRSLDRETLRREPRNEAPAPDEPPPAEEPDLSFDEFQREYGAEWAERPGGIDPVEESAELLGLCLWDVFSDGHEVISADGRAVHLGSFRGTAGEIAEFFAPAPAAEPDEDDDIFRSEWDGADYMRFYMGTIWLSGRADLTPVYRLIFRRLQAQGADWRYSFPRLFLISPAEFAEHAGLSYDPSQEVANEIERAAQEEEAERTRKKLDRANLKAQREARAKPPPETVRAYQEVFGKFPSGWPPDPYRTE